MKHRAFVLLVLLLIPGWQAAGSDRPRRTARPWPLAGNPNLSSSFGEYRDGHLHAGIDIRTGGKDGAACLAVGDGYVSRIRASPYGYGKALYLRLATGETAVYAHLSEFSAAIEDWVFEEQRRMGKYQVDLYPDPWRFPVREGEIICYSGSTGAGAPHLHFEIRDEQERPMNPMRMGWSLPDDIRPVIDRIVWIPLGKNSRINGAAFPLEAKADKIGEGRFACRDTVSLSGPVGMIARIFDRHNGASGRLAPYRVQLLVDGERRALFEMGRFSFKQGVQVDLIYEMERVLSRREYFLTLFARPGETIWNRWFSNAGVIDPPVAFGPAYTTDAGMEAEENAGGTTGNAFHTAEIHAVDCFGNSSVLAVSFSGGGEGLSETPKIPREDAGNSSAESPAFFLFDDFLSIRTDLVGEEGLAGLFAALRDSPDEGRRLDSNNAWMHFTAVSSDFDTTLIVLPPSPAVGDYPLYIIPVHGNPETQFYLTELEADIGVPDRALYSEGFISLSEWDAGDEAGKTQQELQLRSKIIRVGPLSLAVRSFLELSFRSGEPWSGKEAVYQLNERKGKWSFRPTLTTEESISTHVRRPGVYAVSSDGKPPRIGSPVLNKHRMLADGRIFAEIVISLVDDGAGLDDENTKILIDGEEQIARWDGFSKKIFVLLREQNIIGIRGLTVIALDRAGNESQLQTSLTITKDYFSDSAKRNGDNVE